MHGVFEEVLFYQRFRKIKIVESTLTITKDNPKTIAK